MNLVLRLKKILEEDGVKVKRQKKAKTPTLNNSTAISRTNDLLEETKALGLDDDSEEMSGGESEEDEEKDKR